MGIYNLLLGKASGLSRQQKVDYALLFIAVLLQQIHPIYVCLVFSLILIRDISYKSVYRPFCFVNCIVGIIFFLFFYCGFTNGNMTFYNAVWYSIPSILAVILGHNFAKKNNQPSQVISFLFLIAFFLAFQHIVVTFQDILQRGFINPDRYLLTEGDEDKQRAITARTVELSLAICGIVIVFIRKYSISKHLLLSFVVLAVAAELCTLHYLSRTGIAILAIAMSIGFFLKKGNIKQTIIILGLCIITYYIFKNTELFSLFADREIEGSSIADAGGRTERWLLGLNMLIENPGGYNLAFYAHNFWLDFGRVGGLYSFILLVFFSVALLVKVIRKRNFIKIGECNTFMILIFTITFTTTLFTEPVHSGAPSYMYFYFLFAGFVDGLYSLNKS